MEDPRPPAEVTALADNGFIVRGSDGIRRPRVTARVLRTRVARSKRSIFVSCWRGMSAAVSAVMKTIDNQLLGSVSGGFGEGALEAIGDGVSAVRNFSSGFAAGGLYGTGLKDHQAAMYGNRNDTGFKPGVETGMMFNQALGPVGRLMSWGAGALTPK